MTALVPARVVPGRVVVVLLDSLNRHLVGAYGGDEFATPNLDRFAASAMVFDRHHAGSLPCMPARHDLLVGALDFLWRPWGSIEVWEEALTSELRRRGLTTVLVSDHPHLFEAGGENYHVDFTAWDYVRGHENDPWRTRPDPTWTGTPALPAATGHHRYDDSRTWFREEGDFPGPRTMRAAAEWLRRDAPHHESFLLLVDEFDPHEPFDTPEPWASMYDPSWGADRIIWPPYATHATERGVISAREAIHVRANYGAKLSMIDHWFGIVLDQIDALAADDDGIAVIVCSDHGHYLGEHDTFGKPGAPLWNELRHIPLMIRWPGTEPGRTEALTTTVDLHATLCDVFDVVPEHRTHGRSLVPLLAGRVASVRSHLLAGYWGRHVYVLDATRTYGRSAVGDGFPLEMWSNRWSSMPIAHAAPQYRFPRPDRRATLTSMPGTTAPVIRQPFAPGDLLPFWAYGMPVDDHHLYATDDTQESDNQVGSAGEAEAIDLLREALESIEAPRHQFERLGLG